MALINSQTRNSTLREAAETQTERIPRVALKMDTARTKGNKADLRSPGAEQKRQSCYRRVSCGARHNWLLKTAMGGGRINKPQVSIEVQK